MACCRNGPNGGTNSDRRGRIDGLGKKCSRDLRDQPREPIYGTNRKNDISDEEAGQGDRVIGIIIVEDGRLKTLKTSVGTVVSEVAVGVPDSQVTTVEVGAQVQENGKWQNTQIYPN